MGVFNALEFDGINSLDYGVYITGEAVFNSPQRAVEAVTVPGRNGDVLLDLGRYENIEVTYHAGVFGVNQDQFAKKIRAFRNVLASKVGYKRIVDTYNPTEYRLGTFVAPVDVTPSSMNRHGEFDIVFNCKPQRFLMDGENAITVTDGQSVFNPTPFDAQPLLAVDGYGEIAFNGYSINMLDPYRGETMFIDPRMLDTVASVSGKPLEVANLDDDITINPFTYYWELHITDLWADNQKIGTVTITDSGDLGGVTTLMTRETDRVHFRTVLDPISVATWPTTQVRVTHTITLGVTYYRPGYDPSTYTQTVTAVFGIDYKYNSSAQTFTMTRYFDITGVQDPLNLSIERISTDGAIVNSTEYLLGTPTYIDCELGEAYVIENGEYISLNDHIDLGSDLPTLAPGNNTFEIDNTITDVKLTPRWWIL